MNNKTFYPAIDGLRTISFIIVFLFHAGVPGFRLGWGGVTIFFAISGFLITGILLRNKTKKSYFRSFYIRRSLRIFPLYYLTISIPVLFVIFWYSIIPEGFIYLFTYTQNYFFELFQATPYMSLLSHTWTLAIEEQFYIIWPFIIYFINNKYLKIVFISLIIFSVLFRTFGIDLSEYNFINLLSQLDSLVLGSTLALFIFNKMEEKKLMIIMKASLIIGVSGIVFTLIYLANLNNLSLLDTFMEFGKRVKYTNNQIGVNLFFFISLIAVGLIILCVLEKGYVFKFLNIGILINLGRITYGMYLFHYPILYFLRIFNDNILFLCVFGFATTYVVSIISFNTFELYFNRLKTKFTYR